MLNLRRVGTNVGKKIYLGTRVEKGGQSQKSGTFGHLNIHMRSVELQFLLLLDRWRNKYAEPGESLIFANDYVSGVIRSNVGHR